MSDFLENMLNKLSKDKPAVVSISFFSINLTFQNGSTNMSITRWWRNYEISLTCEYILQAGQTEEKIKLVEPPENENQETQDVIINNDTAEEGEVVGEERK